MRSCLPDKQGLKKIIRKKKKKVKTDFLFGLNFAYNILILLKL